MSGIGKYFHGEEGEVLGLSWIADEDSLIYTMFLRCDPFRCAAQDYGSDINIDPSIKVGDRVTYLRLSPFVGIWVKQGQDSSEDIEQALTRAGHNQRHIRKYLNDFTDNKSSSPTEWLVTLAAETGIPARMRNANETIGINYNFEPSSRPSLFLSYSHKDVLVARQLYEDLKGEAKSQVWLDLAESGESATHDEEVAEWLKRAIDSSHIFVVLFTAAAASSEWVQNEMKWASQKAKKEINFHLVLLNLEDVKVAQRIRTVGHIINCKGLSTGEILEELYAAVYKYRGRRQWLAEQGIREKIKDQEKIYHHLVSDSGIAIALRWTKNGNNIKWILDYRRDNEKRQVEGGGEKEVVDLDIKPGDRVGFFNSRRGTTVWMRSDNLSITPDDVIDRYRQKLRAPSVAVCIINLLVGVCGLLIISLAVTIYIYYSLTIPIDSPPPGLDARLERQLRILSTILVAASVVINGMFQLINAAHPQQFENRTLTEALRFMRAALTAVSVGTVVQPLVYLLGITLLYGVVVGIIATILQAIFGGNWLPVFLYGLILTYGSYVILTLGNLWKFVVELPESRFYPCDPSPPWI